LHSQGRLTGGLVRFRLASVATIVFDAFADVRAALEEVPKSQERLA
jgi:hypothetical protein